MHITWYIVLHAPFAKIFIHTWVDYVSGICESMEAVPCDLLDLAVMHIQNEVIYVAPKLYSGDTCTWVNLYMKYSSIYSQTILT